MKGDKIMPSSLGKNVVGFFRLLRETGPFALASLLESPWSPFNSERLYGDSVATRTTRKRRLLFLPGWLAPADLAIYSRLKYGLAASGFSLVTPNCSWRELHFGNLFDTYVQMKVFAEKIRPHGLIGHSWGGLLALAIGLELNLPTVAIATPLRGTPNHFLSRAFMLAMGIRDRKVLRRLGAIRREILSEAPHALVLLISAEDDSIAPPENCRIADVPQVICGGSHVSVMRSPATLDAVRRFMSRRIRALPAGTWA